MQAWIIGLMPYMLMFVLFFISPDMMDSFFSSFAGILLLIAVITMDLIGFMAIRKITTIDI